MSPFLRKQESSGIAEFWALPWMPAFAGMTMFKVTLAWGQGD